MYMHFIRLAIRNCILEFRTDEDTLTRAILLGSEIGMDKINDDRRSG
jgi:hypothetical protein